MKLYSATGTCSMATQIVLTEAGADFELVKVNLRGDRKLPDGRHLNDINPKGYVPVLELDDGTLLTENVAILPYVADLYPDARLAPPHGTLERVRLHEWLGYVSSEVHKLFSHLFNPNLPEAMRPILTDRLNVRFGYIDKHLADNDYLLGDRFSVVDAYLYVVASWGPKLKYDLSAYDNLRRWQEQVGGRQAVQEVMG